MGKPQLMLMLTTGRPPPGSAIQYGCTVSLIHLKTPEATYDRAKILSQNRMPRGFQHNEDYHGRTAAHLRCPEVGDW